MIYYETRVCYESNIQQFLEDSTIRVFFYHEMCQYVVGKSSLCLSLFPNNGYGMTNSCEIDGHWFLDGAFQQSCDLSQWLVYVTNMCSHCMVVL